jgi:hypothetical protein
MYRRKPKIAVFGTGPSGMAVGGAGLQAGYGVDFYGKTAKPSVLYGCQYLHAPIPVLPEFKVRQTRVEYILEGTASDYRRKVYGDAWDGAVSPEDFVGEHDAWDIRATYDALWRMITRRNNVNLNVSYISSNWIGLNTSKLSPYAHIVSTIPAPELCMNPVYLPAPEGH